MFAVFLALQGRSCLVVGGGAVAFRKVESLLEEGACVTVVSPQVCEELAALAADRRITLRRRRYRPGEAGRYAIVFAATDDREVNARVYRDGDSCGVFVNVADDPELCSFHVPARVRRGSLQLAVASGGEAPFVVRRLRELLERRFGPEWGEWIDAASRFRALVRSSVGGHAEAAFDRFFCETVDCERLRARIPTVEEMTGWSAGKSAGHAQDGGAIGTPPGSAAPLCGRPGLVSLVGAGPGNPGLLTVKALRRLGQADAVVYDRLAAGALPPDLPATVELHCVGKEAGHHPVPQEEISQLLVRLAREGKRVVRLKGGDPYVFGRGGEEGETLRAAGILFEVVPGVTAAVGAAAYAGIPVTHRGEAVRLTLLTAHESAKAQGPQTDWGCLAADPHATLVGYMGVTSLPRVVERLLTAGMDPDTPAAVVERGTTAQQRRIRATLKSLPAEAARAGVKPPALFFIGRTVAHCDDLDWFSSRPLAGERIVVAARRDELARTLEEAGAEVVSLPFPLTPAARIVVSAAPVTMCVVVTPAEVEEMDACRNSTAWGDQVRVWCCSPEAADRARAVALGVVEEVDGVEGVLTLRRGPRDGRAD